jgi:hypothetical protein
MSSEPHTGSSSLVPTPENVSVIAAPSTIEKTLVFDFGTYRGEVCSTTGLRHGWGVLQYNSGNSYEGLWHQGAHDGEGVKRYRNGDVYCGTWVAGKRVGKGEYSYVQGDVYIGEYDNDVCHGRGRIVTHQGDSYDGEWRLGKKAGHGVETLASGQTYDGEWLFSKKHGNGALTTASERIHGVWEHDKLVDITSRQEMEYQPQVRPMPTSALSMSSHGSSDVEGVAIAPHVVEDLRRAGADPAIIRAMTDFSENMSSRMGNLMGSIGGIETQLSALTDALENLAGLDEFDDAMLDQIGSIEEHEDDDDDDQHDLDSDAVNGRGSRTES